MKMAFKILAVLVVSYAVFLSWVYYNQRNMMYFPPGDRPDPQKSDMLEIAMLTSDDLQLYSWHRLPQTPEYRTIVYFHGNASNVEAVTARMAPFLEKGFGLLAVEYRGYGGNPGVPSEEGLYNDARANMEWLKTISLEHEKIIIYGESIGSGPAVQMALEYQVGALVLDSAFPSAVDAASFHYPYFPVKWLLKDRYENINKIERIRTALIMLHGDKDSIIPYDLGKKLFDKAIGPKTLITVEGGGHNNLDQFKAYEKVLHALNQLEPLGAVEPYPF